MRTVMLTLMLAILAGCGLTQSQVDTLIDLDKAMASEYADLSQSFYSWAEAVEAASPAGTVTHAKAIETKLYILKKNQNFTTLVNDLARAVISAKELDPAQKQALLDDLFQIIDKLKTKGGE